MSGVCIDVNEDIHRKSIRKALINGNGLNIEEAVDFFSGKRTGAIFFRGVKLIDRVWVTSDIVITGACVMLTVGDRRILVIGILTPSLIGHNPPKIMRTAARRLVITIPNTGSKYVGRLKDLIVEHRLVERVGEANTKSTSKVALN